MSASAIGALVTPQLSPLLQSANQHRHRVHAPPLSDLETQGASAPSAAPSAGPPGGKVDLKV